MCCPICKTKKSSNQKKKFKKIIDEIIELSIQLSKEKIEITKIIFNNDELNALVHNYQINDSSFIPINNFPKLKNIIEKEINWLKERGIEAWKSFYDRLINKKHKI